MLFSNLITTETQLLLLSFRTWSGISM